jgi:hypothetical protein
MRLGIQNYKKYSPEIKQKRKMLCLVLEKKIKELSALFWAG